MLWLCKPTHEKIEEKFDVYLLGINKCFIFAANSSARRGITAGGLIDLKDVT